MSRPIWTADNEQCWLCMSYSKSGIMDLFCKSSFFADTRAFPKNAKPFIHTDYIRYCQWIYCNIHQKTSLPWNDCQPGLFHSLNQLNCDMVWSSMVFNSQPLLYTILEWSDDQFYEHATPYRTCSSVAVIGSTGMMQWRLVKHGYEV